MNYPIFDLGPERSSVIEDYMSGYSFHFSLGTENHPHVRLVPKFASKKGGVSFAPALAAVKQLAELEDFKGKPGQTIFTTSDANATVYFGCGTGVGFKVSTFRKALTGAFKKAKTLKVGTVAVELPDAMFEKGGVCGKQSPYAIGRAIAEIGSMALYGMNHRKTDKESKEGPTVTHVVVIPGDATDRQKSRLNAGLHAGGVIGTAVNLARNLGNDPANILTPVEFARYARNVAAESGGKITCEVLVGRDAILKAGMKAFHAVSKGSVEEPQFIILRYKHPKAKKGVHLGGVGKSIMFDTGGINLKTGAGPSGMKYDMCGGAAMIASIHAIAQLDLPIEMTVFCAATTNRTGSAAYLPDDVYVGLDGKSYEIGNTDAEGRLTLVDAIAYARKNCKVTHVVDMATLTGAVITALGDVAAGAFTNNQKWLNEVMAAGESVGERLWQLPTWPEYDEGNKSDMADLKNVGSNGAGPITAAKFVLSATGKTPTVHLDIAGTAFRGRPFEADPKGGTGYGVRTMVALAERLAKTKGKKPGRSKR